MTDTRPKGMDDVAAPGIPKNRFGSIRRIGEGASSVVYEVADCEDGGRTKALKVVRESSHEGFCQGVEAMRSEFRIAARFRHPNLVECYELDLRPDDGYAGLLMEFVRGDPLGSKPEHPAAAFALAIELLEGLGFLHECGYVHGDIKPPNALRFDEDGRPRVKLLDFHLSGRAVPDAADLPRGTLLYMAPEVIEGKPPTPQSDLYSVGCLIFQTLTGAPPHTGTAREIMSGHLYAAPDLDVAGIGKEFRSVLGRLLAKGPMGRYRTAREAIVALRERLGEHAPARSVAAAVGRIRSSPLFGREEEIAAFRDFIARPAPACMALCGPKGAGKSRLLREFEIEAQGEGWLTLRASAQQSPARTLRSVSRLAQTRKVLLFGDDADVLLKSGLPGFMRLVRLALKAGCRVCIAVTAEGLSPSPPTSECGDVSHELIFDALDDEAATGFVQALLPQIVLPEDASRLVRKCGARPGAIIHMAEWVASEGCDPAEALKAGPEIFGSLAEDVSHSPGQIAKAASILGLCEDALPLHAVLAEAGCTEGAFDESLLGPLAGAMRFRKDRGRVMASFSNRFLADAIAQRLSPSETRALYDTVSRLEIRESLVADARMLTVIRHRLLGSDPSHAVADFIALAKDEKRRSQAEEMLPLFPVAEAAATDREKRVLQELRGDLLNHIGDVQNAREAYGNVVSATGDGSARERITRKLANLEALKGDAAAARRLIGRLLVPSQETERQRPEEAAQYYLALSLIELRESNLDASAASAGKALSLAEQTNSPTLQGEALLRQGTASLERGNSDDARRHVKAAFDQFQGADSLQGMGACYYAMAKAALVRKELREAESLSQKSESCMSRAGSPGGVAFALSLAGVVKHEQELWAEAAQHYAQAFEIYSRLGQTFNCAINLFNASQVNAYRGDLSSAIDQASQAVPLVSDNPKYHCHALMKVARASFDLGDMETAEARSSECLKIARKSGLHAYQESAFRTLGEVENMNADPKSGAGIALLNHARRIAAEFGLVDNHLICLGKIAAIEVEMGQIANAFKTLKHAFEISDSLGVPTGRRNLLMAQGKAWLAEGKLEEAYDAFLGAEEAATRRRVWDSLAEVNVQLGKVCLAQERYRTCRLFLKSALESYEQAFQFLDDRQGKIFLRDRRRRELSALIGILANRTSPPQEA